MPIEKTSTSLSLALIPFASIVDFLSLDTKKLFILAALMTLDIITGMAKAYKLDRDITARRLAEGFVSKLSILIIPLAIALMAKGVEFDMTFFIGFAISVLMVSETYSVIGNIYTSRTGNAVKEIDAVSAIVRSLGRFLEAMLRGK